MVFGSTSPGVQSAALQSVVYVLASSQYLNLIRLCIDDLIRISEVASDPVHHTPQLMRGAACLLSTLPDVKAVHQHRADEADHQRQHERCQKHLDQAKPSL